ncbi:MAG: type II toxin-antitoxin system PemK/MazF family toxin [Phycisphaerae bacterium]
MAGDADFRPVVIVSRIEAIAQRRNITIAEVTRVVRSLPSEVHLSIEDDMPSDCVINTDNLHTIPQDRLRQCITMISEEHLFSLERALRYSLDLQW